MGEYDLGVLADLLSTVVSTVGAIAFTVIGLLVDRAGLQDLLAGAVVQGAWELWMGTLALFVGAYLLGYRTAWPAISGRH